MKKYFVVDPVRYELLMNTLDAQKLSSSRDELFTHPNVKKTKEIDKEMEKILHDNHLSDYEKNEQFNNKLNGFVSNFRTAITTPKSEALLGKPSDDKQDDSSSHSMSPNLLEKTLNSIPNSYQQNARKLINFLKGNEAFTWNEIGELKYKGKIIQGSDVNKLLNDAVRNKKISSGDNTFENFLSALKSEGYPVHKLSNQKKKKAPSYRVEKPKKKFRSADYNTISSILKSWVKSK